MITIVRPNETGYAQHALIRFFTLTELTRPITKTPTHTIYQKEEEEQRYRILRQ